MNRLIFYACFLACLVLNGVPLTAASQKDVKTKAPARSETPPPPPRTEEDDDVPPPPPAEPIEEESEDVPPPPAAEPTIPLEKREQWFKAARDGDLDTIKRLDARYTDLLNARDYFGNTALLKALYIPNTGLVNKEFLATKRALKEDVINFLLRHDADVTVINNDGSNALILAAEAGFGPKILKAIIDKGVPITSKTRAGKTALMGAAAPGHLDVVKFLLDNGALSTINNVAATIVDDDQTLSNATALILAAKNSRADIVELLLKSGADATIKASKFITGKGLVDLTARDFAYGEQMQKIFDKYKKK